MHKERVYQLAAGPRVRWKWLPLCLGFKTNISTSLIRKLKARERLFVQSFLLPFASLFSPFSLSCSSRRRREIISIYIHLHECATNASTDIPALKIFPSRWQHKLMMTTNSLSLSRKIQFRFIPFFSNLYVYIFFLICSQLVHICLKQPLMIIDVNLPTLNLPMSWTTTRHTVIYILSTRRAGRWLSNRSAWCVVKHATWSSTSSLLALFSRSSREP